jgi:DtxR family Mn-dependent transcriptional regulator
MGVAPASVTGMLQKLAASKPPLVTYRKHRGATLTKAGALAALEVIRHHRLLETWLVKSLGYSWEEVHSEAERLEHVISEDMEHRISAALGNPRRDPHGEPIPSQELRMPRDHSVPLTALAAGDKAIIVRVRAESSGLLLHLKSCGLIPGAQVQALDVSEYDKIVRIKVHGHKAVVALGPEVASQVFADREQQ